MKAHYSRWNSDRVFILLGTFNGGEYLAEQIKSVQAQTYQNWELLIRDDGSSDSSPEIIRSFSRKDERIQVFSDNKGNLGVAANYNELMKTALNNDAGIVFFCDQDDVWLPDKIRTQTDAIKKIESRHGATCPVLVHTDMRVVDKHLKPIHPSFLLSCSHVLSLSKTQLASLLPGNCIAACSSALNRALLGLATPIPYEAPIHDWWIALCAAACGQIHVVRTPLTLYRQHEKNKIGAMLIKNPKRAFYKNIKNRLWNIHKNFILSVHQADRLKKRIQDQGISVPTDVLKCIDDYANCLKTGRVRRLKIIRQNGIGRPGMLHQIVFHVLLSLSYDSHRSGWQPTRRK